MMSIIFVYILILNPCSCVLSNDFENFYYGIQRWVDLLGEEFLASGVIEGNAVLLGVLLIYIINTGV